MSVVPVKFTEAPTHPGPLLLALAVSTGFTVTVTSAVKAESPEMVHLVDIRMKYVPVVNGPDDELAAVAPPMGV